MSKEKIFRAVGILSIVPRDFKDIGRAPVGKGKISLRREDKSEISLKKLWKMHLGSYISLYVKVLEHSKEENKSSNIFDIDDKYYSQLDEEILTYRERGVLFLKPQNYGESLFEAIEQRGVIGVIINKGETISLRKMLESFLGEKVELSFKFK